MRRLAIGRVAEQDGLAERGDDAVRRGSALGLFYVVLNSSRPLFANASLRKAVNFALDRRRLSAGAGAPGLTPTDRIVPGFADASVYPLDGPDLTRARALATGFVPARAELYTCLDPACLARAADIRADLAQIGITVNVHSFPRAEQIARQQRPGEPYDLGLEARVADPLAMLDQLVRGGGPSNYGRFDDPYWDRQLDAAAALSGAERHAAYAALDERLMREAAPLAPFARARLGSLSGS